MSAYANRSKKPPIQIHFTYLGNRTRIGEESLVQVNMKDEQESVRKNMSYYVPE